MATTSRVLPAAIVLGLLGSGAVVWQASYASFTATTSTPTNSFTSGKVVLTNSSTGSAPFTAAGLVPGSTETKCLDVTYAGNVNADIKFYATSGGTTTLAPYLNFRVDQIPNGTSCPVPSGSDPAALYGGSTGATDLATLLTSNGSYVNGLGTWTANASDTRRFRFTYVLRDDNAAQDKTAQVNLTWEARNIP